MEQRDMHTAQEISRLCLHCQLCCQGNICHVVLTPDELGKFSGFGLAIRRQSDQNYFFTEVCPYLHDDGCSIYSKQLLNDCSSYRCRTLKQLLNGKIDLITAQQRVDRVKKQIRAVIAGLRSGESGQANMQDLLGLWLKEKRYRRQPDLLSDIRNLLTDIDHDFHAQRLLAKLIFKQKRAGIKITLGASKLHSTLIPPDKPADKDGVAEIIFSAQGLQTPAYIIDESTLEQLVSSARSLAKQAGARLLYSMKANSIVPVLEKIAPLVDGISCSSLPELLLARQATHATTNLHFTAPGIGAKEAEAIARECRYLSFNSLSQWDHYQGVLHADLSTGLRVNPHLTLANRPHYDPCRAFSKLGISVDQLQEIWQQAPERFQSIAGLHVHNAVGEVDFSNFLATSRILEQKIPELLHRLSWINLGGGYRLQRCKNRPLFLEACASLQEKYGLQVFIEPGTALVQRACWLLTSVVDIFSSNGKKIAVLDSSVNHQLEAFIYNFKPLVYGVSSRGQHSYLLAGATCLAGDLLGEHRFLQPLQIGSRILFKSVGAYTHAFSIQYNGLNFPSIYWLQPDKKIILKRQFTIEDFARRCAAEDSSV
jgi:carboxynorspermidine decarboxylase